ncbi:type II toxin-antitoxin system VapC family toxin [Alkalinema pantanalense CENA528]|uniref:type II toxin-antitoxin system VapC family toxin n=1 Tax=Alkalinema pantanalense TaxID=1620705 RepID=UPI003D6ED5D2
MARPLALADTSGIIALLDRSDRHHQAAIRIFQQYQLMVPATTLPEIDYLASKYLGEPSARAFFQDLTDCYYTYQTVDLQDIQNALKIMAQYQGVPLGIVDSTIIALAERYQIPQILTLDRRHFSLIQPKQLPYLELLP